MCVWGGDNWGGDSGLDCKNVLARYHFIAPNHYRTYIPKSHSEICPLPTQLPSQNLHFKECSLISLRFKSISVVYVKLLQRAMGITSSYFGTRNEAGCTDKSESAFSQTLLLFHPLTVSLGLDCQEVLSQVSYYSFPQSRFKDHWDKYYFNYLLCFGETFENIYHKIIPMR